MKGFATIPQGSRHTALRPPPFRTGDLSLIKNAPLNIQLYDTQTLGAGGQPTAYPNNQVPITNPVALFLFSHPNVYPLPESPKFPPIRSTSMATTLAPRDVFSRNDQGDVKIDWHPHTSDVVSGRYSQGYAQDGTVSILSPSSFPVPRIIRTTSEPSPGPTPSRRLL